MCANMCKYMQICANMCQTQWCKMHICAKQYLGGAGLRHAQLTGATIIGRYCKIRANLDGARFEKLIDAKTQWCKTHVQHSKMLNL